MRGRRSCRSRPFAQAVPREGARPGLAENEIWAHLRYENIRHGGEWIETRLLASGPRTNPWMHECSSRVLQNAMRAFALVRFARVNLLPAHSMCR